MFIRFGLACIALSVVMRLQRDSADLRRELGQLRWRVQKLEIKIETADPRNTPTCPPSSP